MVPSADRSGSADGRRPSAQDADGHRARRISAWFLPGADLGFHPSTPVAEWEAPTGPDSGEPRWRKKMKKTTMAATARRPTASCRLRFQKVRGGDVSGPGDRVLIVGELADVVGGQPSDRLGQPGQHEDRAHHQTERPGEQRGPPAAASAPARIWSWSSPIRLTRDRAASDLAQRAAAGGRGEVAAFARAWRDGCSQPRSTSSVHQPAGHRGRAGSTCRPGVTCRIVGGSSRCPES